MLLRIALVFLVCLVALPAAAKKSRTELWADSIRLQNEAIDLWPTGDWDKIEGLLSKALEAHEAAVGPYGTGVASLIDIIARVHHSRRDYREAADWYREAADVAERSRSLGPLHPLRAAYLDSLGLVLRKDGRAEAAVPVLQHALQIRASQPEPDSDAIAESLENLGEAYLAIGRFAAAEVVLKDAAAIHQRSGSANASLRQRVTDLLNEATAALDAERRQLRRGIQLRAAAIAAGVSALVILTLTLWWETPRLRPWASLKRLGVLIVMVVAHLVFAVGLVFLGSVILGGMLIDSIIDRLPEVPEVLASFARGPAGLLVFWLGYLLLIGAVNGLRAGCRRPIALSFLASPAHASEQMR